MLATPRDAGGFDMRLRDFPPGSELAVVAKLSFHQLLILRIDERIVLEKKCRREIVFVRQRNLLLHRIEHKAVGIIKPVVGLTDEIHYIDYSRRCLRVFRALGGNGLTRTASQTGCIESESAYKRSESFQLIFL